MVERIFSSGCDGVRTTGAGPLFGWFVEGVLAGFSFHVEAVPVEEGQTPRSRIIKASERPSPGSTPNNAWFVRRGEWFGFADEDKMISTIGG
jgi:hypothetical protein